ncbi:hypothetical protein [Jeotgalibacillus proteolyticus]|uniref:hypothetical protein n=1 Tax=Jeotgalibacillus proteolyticus TaxID=2082395 RepID=UPI003CEF0F1B
MLYHEEQQRLMVKVIDYIEEHLTEELSLQHLASKSTYSTFHFQRLFKEMIG